MQAHALFFSSKVNLFYRDSGGNGIMLQNGQDGLSFSYIAYTGLTCDVQPRACCADGTIIVVAVDHNGNGIMLLRADNG